MITVKVTNDEPKLTERTYPYLGVLRDNESVVVLFTAKNTGVILNDGALGNKTMGSSWKFFTESEYYSLKGSITLTQ